jgi:hypothetical protein
MVHYTSINIRTSTINKNMTKKILNYREDVKIIKLIAYHSILQLTWQILHSAFPVTCFMMDLGNEDPVSGMGLSAFYMCTKCIHMPHVSKLQF